MEAILIISWMAGRKRRLLNEDGRQVKSLAWSQHLRFHFRSSIAARRGKVILNVRVGREP